MPDAISTTLPEDGLWTPAELARFLGYSTSTVERMASQKPASLPPRVAMLSKPRWVPEVVREWARQCSAPTETRRRRGRPRKPA